MYTIYKGFLPEGRWKIGCDESWPNRAQEQNLTNYFVLEEHTNIYIASRREKELQKEHGVRVDNIPYYMSRQMASKGGRISGRNNVESGQIKNYAKAGSRSVRKLTFEQAEEIRHKNLVENVSKYKLAAEYDVSRATIRNIVNNKYYLEP